MNLSDIKERTINLAAEKIVPPPVLVHGAPGTGKTTTGLKIAETINAKLKMIQCSRWNTGTAQELREFCYGSLVNIDFLMGSDESIPMIILDEIDQFGSSINQLRPILDEFSESVFFYATTNYIDKIPDAVADRFLASEIVASEVSLRQQALLKRLTK